LPLRLLSIPATECLRLSAYRGRGRSETSGELVHSLTDRGAVVTPIFLEHDVAPCAAVLNEGADNRVCIQDSVEVVESDLVV
jgi:hypothetical protein